MLTDLKFKIFSYLNRASFMANVGNVTFKAFPIYRGIVLNFNIPKSANGFSRLFGIFLNSTKYVKPRYFR